MAEGLTFYSKSELICPVCGVGHKREEMLTGRGRFNAGALSNELRRSYIATQKFGEVNPLIYPVAVCPSCLFAADKDDFTKVPPKSVEQLLELQQVRGKYMLKIFGMVPDFVGPRELISGIGSYILAISSSPFLDKRKQAPTIKMGIYSLRTAWLMIDLFRQTNEPKYQELSDLFYRKASEFYEQALELQSKGIEPLDGARWLGPDTDYNFGYDGFLYIDAVLKYKTAVFMEDPIERVKCYEGVKRILSKVFGIGRKAKDKPEILLNLSREVYDKIGEEVEKLKESLGDLNELENLEQAVEEAAKQAAKEDAQASAEAPAEE
ncbi:MAG: hypothetical protein A2Y33_09405 [Spirochaetes bacterium GWF1_51_8]|nr:MAG: hypothetical protein A2Y33_09405 [Spirochaetes bacterium GWF1_51_8]